jgi:hypothetical protein
MLHDFPLPRAIVAWLTAFKWKLKRGTMQDAAFADECVAKAKLNNTVACFSICKRALATLILPVSVMERKLVVS